MQDVHPLETTTTTTGRILTDRRHTQQPTAEALKCPRCESLNTKFCYYNNYNLSQPRHFCKSCRRYWTNGGVLRNVPVGGGSRKPTKRSKLKPKISSVVVPTTSATTIGGVLDQNARTEPNSQADQILPAPEVGGVSVTSNSDPNPKPDPGPLGLDGSVTASFGETQMTEEWEMSGGPQMEGKMQNLAGGVLDRAGRIDDPLQSRGSEGGVVALDWQGIDQNGFGFFDDQVYWNQATKSFDDHHHLQQHWSDHHSSASNNDNFSLFLP